MKIAVLASHTIRGIEHDNHEWYICEYDKIYEEATNSNSDLYKFGPDAILISCFDEYVFDILENMSTQIPIFVHTIPKFPSDWDEVERLEANASLYGYDVHVLDIEELMYQEGVKCMYDYRMFYLADKLFSDWGLSAIRKQLYRGLQAKFGKRKKCLVVDLDNTLWEGILADGISVTKAHRRFQKEIKNLIESGIILAVCSKNDEFQALEVLENHPDMILKKKDLAAWRINWDSKSRNIQEIADELNISTDSIVFLDDNHLERLEVEVVLPDVLVPNMPQDFAEYPEFLKSIREFDTYDITETDQIRNKMYVEERSRKESSTGMQEEDFLKSLNIVIQIEPVNQHTILRVVQLSERTNQFNMNGSVFGKDQIEKLESYTISAQDKFGDQGIVGACVLDGGIVTGLFMSCRVLGRGIEQAFLSKFYPAPLVIKDTGKNKAFLDFIHSFQEGIPEWIEIKSSL